MADGLLSGVLGGDDDKPEVEAPRTLANAEAYAAAVAAIASHHDPGVARKTEEFLGQQTQLLRVQKEHLIDEHAVRLHMLQSEAREVDIRRFSLRLRVGFQLFLVLIATTLGVGVAVMIHDAFSSRSVVIDAFGAPPSLAPQGLNGQVLAADLLDVLTRIQAASRANVEHRQLSNAWTNDIAIDVPETGISIGQIERTLKERFGHDQRIDGDLVRADSGGLALTVRGTGILPQTFTGDAGALSSLLTQAGEYVYGQSQPGLWTAYLSNNGRDADAIRFAQAAYARVALSERPYVLNYWANALVDQGAAGADAKALPLYREAVRLKPDFWIGYNNIMSALFGRGDEEEVVGVGKQLMKLAGGRPGRAPEIYYQNYDQAVWDLRAEHAELLADADAHGGVGTAAVSGGAEYLSIAQIDAQLHDVEAAALRLQMTPVDPGNIPDVAAAALDRALLAEERGDLAAAAGAWDAYAAAYANPTVSTNNPNYICFSAVTYQKTGQSAKADAALAAVGARKFVDCDRFRGDVQDLRGDWAGAQAWYAKAVKLAPDIPSGYYSWGLALARHGDLNAAAARLEEANRKGPHWADPLKAWGDVLARQGKTAEALAKYDEALQYAPKWKELQQARAAAARQS